MKVQSPRVPVETVLFFAYFRFWSICSCLSSMRRTPSGRSLSWWRLMISSKILSLLYCFFLLILSKRFTSQYQGIGLATNSKGFLYGAVWIFFGAVILSVIGTILAIISNLNLSKRSNLSLSWSFIILSKRFYFTCFGTYFGGIGFIFFSSSNLFYSSISLTLFSRMDIFLFLSLWSKPKATGIVTLYFFFRS